jgi:GMP synthase (glutamine-hydrolysing)
MDSIAVLDFGSQTTQLIVRRVREAHVYCELFPYDTAETRVMALVPKGFILSGGPPSVYEADAPQIPDYVLSSGLPVLGICYGMQALTHALGGRVAASAQREFGLAEVERLKESPLLRAARQPVWMSHGDRIEAAPDGFEVIARTDNAPIAAMADQAKRRFGLQFHPEVRHTPGGPEILRAFVLDVCQAEPSWTTGSMIEQAIQRVRDQVDDRPVLAAVSGGVDSAVAAALVGRAVGDQLVCLFVDTGLLRAGEAESVERAFRQAVDARLEMVDASRTFLDALSGVTDPETKRRIVGEKFIRTFETEAQRLGQPPFLVQGTIYPDVVESSGPERQVAARIKTHHNVGGLPPDLDFQLVEPLRYLFKDEVRQVGLELGLPRSLILRQPFPGPGLAVRCLGDVSPDRLNRLRAADKIVTDELLAEGLLTLEADGQGTSQAFAVLLPIRSVGVMGDQRTYQETVAIRAVTSEDFMTADWARLPDKVLARISSRIVNEVEGVNRVVYDITSKPPATIEWE